MTHDAKKEILPDELLWAGGGHASDIALTAIADGQREIVGAALLAHVEGCRSCMTHLGHNALLAIHTDREMALLARASVLAVRGRLPRLAIGLGLIVAVLGLVPSLLDAPTGVERLKGFVMHDVPTLVTGLGVLRRHWLAPGSPVALAVTYGALALIVLMAFAVVRLFPKKEVSR